MSTNVLVMDDTCFFRPRRLLEDYEDDGEVSDDENIPPATKSTKQSEPNISKKRPCKPLANHAMPPPISGLPKLSMSTELIPVNANPQPCSTEVSVTVPIIDSACDKSIVNSNNCSAVATTESSTFSSNLASHESHELSDLVVDDMPETATISTLVVGNRTPHVSS
jgi:hypothetical protein